MTKDERRHLSDVADLGCVVCRNLGFGDTPAEVHHIRTGQGMSQRASHYETIPLCPYHHRHGGDDAVHGNRRRFEERYGTEKKLLEQTLIDLKTYNARRI